MINKLEQYINLPEVFVSEIDVIHTIERRGDFPLNQKMELLLGYYSKLSDTNKSGRAGRYIIIRIGELCFKEKELEEAKYHYSFAMKFSDTIGNPFLHLRLGQLEYQMTCENTSRVIDELSRALIMGGKTVFEGEESFFIQIPLGVLDAPTDGGWGDYEGQDWEITR
jgi:hypothetical protein